MKDRNPNLAEENPSRAAKSPGARPLRHVVAALILRGEGPARNIFICQRRAGQPMGLKWEFPGGKIEPGETSEQALIRELNEELGITATIGDRISTVHHSYRNGGAIEIEFFLVHSFQGEFVNHVFQQMRWVPIADLPNYDFLAADLTLIRDIVSGRLLS